MNSAARLLSLPGFQSMLGRRWLHAFHGFIFWLGSTMFAADAPPAVPSRLFDSAAQAKEMFERGDYVEAQLIYERMLKIAPDNVHILTNLGKR